MTLTQHFSRTLALGLPLSGSLVAIVLIGVTDTAMLGRYSVGALAAGSLGATYNFTLYLLAAGFAYAVQGLAADAAGQGDDRRLRRVTRMGMWLSAMAGCAIAPLLIWSEPILLALGQEAQIASDVQAYLRLLALGLIPMLLMTTLRSHLSALEHTRIVLIATLVGVLVNIVLNWLLIFGNLGAPELGLRGAAIASVAVQVTMLGILALYAARGPGMARWELFRNLHRPDWPAMADVARLGWPIGLTHVSEAGLFSAASFMMGWAGTVALAAHGIVLQIASVTFVIHMGLAQAGTVRVGRFAGQGDRAGLRRAAAAATILSAGAVAVSMILYLGVPGPAVAAYLDRADPATAEILAIGAVLMALAGLFQAVDAAQVMALGFLRGLQDTRIPMIYALIAYWAVGMPVSYLLGFPLGWGPAGIWLGLCVGLAVAAVLLTVRFWRRA